MHSQQHPNHFSPNQQQQQQQLLQQQQQQQLLPYPALHLHPVNDTFIPKQIVLNPNGAKVKIGRQTNQKSVPNSTNGFFDSKVLSRMHAEVWTENGKVLIRDVKSSNGTFINGERLSAEGVESEAFELHSDDLVEFGIDIIADDNKSIVHHKVATKVFLVLNAEDAAAASNFYRSNGPDLSLNRRASRPGIFGGGGFDHVLNRLQSELEKSRATGQELNSLNSTMNEIHDTLGGGNGPPPPLPPPYGGRIPPLVQQPPRHQQNLLQSQLAETQASLAVYAEKMKNLETVLVEHEQIKRELTELRDHIEPSTTNQQNPDGDAHHHDLSGRVSPVATMLELQEQGNRDLKNGIDLDDDDCMSTTSSDTMTWKPSSNHLTNDLIKKSHQPQPNGSDSPSSAKLIDSKQIESIMEQNNLLTLKIESISISLDESVKLGQTLMEQHKLSSNLITELEGDIQELKKQLSQQQQRHLDQEFQESIGCSIESKVIEKVEGQYLSWKDRLESCWKEEQINWEKERSSLRQIIKELEDRLVKQEDINRTDRRSLEHGSPTRNATASTTSTPNSSPSKSKRNRKKKLSSSQLGSIEQAELRSANVSSSNQQNGSALFMNQRSSSGTTNTPSSSLSSSGLNLRQTDLSKVLNPSETIGKLFDSSKASSSSPTSHPSKTSSTNKSEPQPPDHLHRSTSPSDDHHSHPANQINNLKYLSAAGGVALIGLVTYAFINHFTSKN